MVVWLVIQQLEDAGHWELIALCGDSSDARRIAEARGKPPRESSNVGSIRYVISSDFAIVELQ